MKRLLFALIVVLAASAAFAQVGDRDVLLTADGTLYAADVVEAKASASGTSNWTLSLTVQQGKTVTHTAVPESIESGMNWRPALAFDTDSQTLFIFWLRRPADSMSSYLYLAAYRDGKWQPAVAIDNRPGEISFRSNLRIGITRHLAQTQKDGPTLDVSALLVHCVWWEDGMSGGEQARYALISVDKGTATVAATHNLSEFVTPSETTDVGSDFNREILRHPAILGGPTSNAVDVLFGDTTTNSFHRVTLKPVLDSRIHIPVPFHGDTPIPGPRAFSNSWSGRVTTIDGHDGRLVLANTTTDDVSYVMFTKGAWSTVKSVPLNEKLTADGALAVLTKMVAAAE